MGPGGGDGCQDARSARDPMCRATGRTDFPRAPKPRVPQAPRPRSLPSARLLTTKVGGGGGQRARGQRPPGPPRRVGCTAHGHWLRRARRSGGRRWVPPRGDSGRALGRGSQRAVRHAGVQLRDSLGRVFVLESWERSGNSHVAWTGVRGRCRGAPGRRSSEGAFLDRARHRGHQAGQHGGPHGGDHGVRVPPAPLQPVRVQQQQGQPAPLRHAGGRPVRQARQT